MMFYKKTNPQKQRNQNKTKEIPQKLQDSFAVFSMLYCFLVKVFCIITNYVYLIELNLVTNFLQGKTYSLAAMF